MRRRRDHSAAAWSLNQVFGGKPKTLNIQAAVERELQGNTTVVSNRDAVKNY